MKKYFVFSLLCISALFNNGTIVTAATPSQYIILSPTHTLLTLSFTETILNKDAIIPVLASSEQSSHSPLTLQYTISSTESSDIKQINAAVLSPLAISRGGYVAPAGSKNQYQLVVLVEHAVDQRPTGIELSALPFLTTENNEIDGRSLKHY